VRPLSRRAGAREGLPTPDALDADIREVIAALRSFRAAYREAYADGLSAPSGSGIAISGNGNSSPTEKAWSSPIRRRLRAACRSSVGWVHRALEDVQNAEAALGGADVKQPRKIDPRGLITQAEFDKALHRRREEALRS